MEKDLEHLVSHLRDSLTDCHVKIDKLKEFFEKHQTSRDFSTVSATISQDTLEALEETLREVSRNGLNLSPVFNVLLILTRNTKCQTLLLEKFLKSILTHASVLRKEQVPDNELKLQLDCRLPAVKCLCNIVFQSQATGEGIDALKNADFERHFSEHMVSVLTTENNLHDYSMDLMFFEFTLYFLYTAIAVDARRYFIDFPGMKKALVTGIDFLIGQMKIPREKCEEDRECSTTHATVLGNLLKTLYTLMAGLEQRDSATHRLDDVTESFYQSVTVACRDVVLLTDVSSPKSFTDGDLLSHTYSVLGVIPSSVLKETFLVNNVQDQNDDEETVVAGNLQLLSKLLQAIKTVTTIQENTTVKITLFLALCNLSRNCRVLRKYLRLKILPPRKDVHVMPQEGQELKNDLVRMMTGVNREIGELVSEFVFVLCKENVDRLLKYTGYGNAAGMMFTRGLGLRSPQPADYSEDEDTDTEEFKGHQHGFNYVTGRYEPPRPDPFEGMSEERKVVETEKLLNTLSRMQCSHSGAPHILPMTMGDHGQPVPLFDHIAQKANERTSTTEESSSDDEH